MGQVNLWYLSGNTYGGWVTFTAHLYHGLKRAGYFPVIRKIGANTETKLRPFGYDAFYTNVAEEDVDQFYEQTNIIVSTKEKMADTVFDLMLHGASIVIHDPTELKGSETRDAIDSTKPPVIVIRRQNMDIVPGRTVFLPHPYQMRYGTEEPTHEKLAVSISRIDFDKKLHILLDANRLLPDDAKIDIRGFENRIYTRFQIVPEYPEWEQSKAHYSRDFDSAVELCREATFMVDMSAIKGDGGGTQYTFLEAWDAGSIVIVNKAWIDGIDPDVCVMKPGVNCLYAGDGEELATVLQFWYEKLSYGGSVRDLALGDLLKMRAEGWRICKEHDAKTIAPRYVEVTLG
jgi:hypothetical protein